MSAISVMLYRPITYWYSMQQHFTKKYAELHL